MEKLDGRDAAIIAEIATRRETIMRPRIGDFVRFPDGNMERFSHDWGDGLQTSEGGSFYLLLNGNASFSGALNKCTPSDQLTLTSETMPGSFWIFHHGLPGAFRGVGFTLPCRVYSTTATA